MTPLQLCENAYSKLQKYINYKYKLKPLREDSTEAGWRRRGTGVRRAREKDMGVSDSSNGWRLKQKKEYRENGLGGNRFGRV